MDKNEWNDHNIHEGIPIQLKDHAASDLKVNLKLRGGVCITLPMKYITWKYIHGDPEREIVEWQLSEEQDEPVWIAGVKIKESDIPRILKETQEYPDKAVEPDVDVNPKAALGLASLPLSLFSPLGVAYGCIGKLNGKLKYGLNNFIGTEVVASIYIDAIKRHCDKWMSGQELDPFDKVPHFSAMLANIDILLNARAAGTLIDDRPLTKGYFEELEKLTPMVKALQELHKDRNPKHYYLKEAEDGTK